MLRLISCGHLIHHVSTKRLASQETLPPPFSFKPQRMFWRAFTILEPMYQTIWRSGCCVASSGVRYVGTTYYLCKGLLIVVTRRHTNSTEPSIWRTLGLGSGGRAVSCTILLHLQQGCILWNYEQDDITWTEVERSPHIHIPIVINTIFGVRNNSSEFSDPSTLAF